MRASFVALAAMLLAPGAYSAATIAPLTSFCSNPKVVSTSYTGVNNDVRVEYTSCDAVENIAELERRQAKNDCGAPCKHRRPIPRTTGTNVLSKSTRSASRPPAEAPTPTSAMSSPTRSSTTARTSVRSPAARLLHAR